MTRLVRMTMLAAAVVTTLAGPIGCTHTGTHAQPTCGAPPCGPTGCTSGGCRPGLLRSGITLGDRYRNLVDPAWPDRYNYAARQSVLAPFAQQAANGHFLNQSIWNWYFEPGTDQLNGAGRAKLDAIARSAPAPDPKIYVQAARDVPLTPENEANYAAITNELTARRVEAVRRYLATQPGQPVAYEIAVHNAPTPGIYAPFSATSFRGQLIGYVGGLEAGGGGLAGQNIAAGTSLLQGGTTVGGPGTPQGSSPTPSTGNGP